MNFDYDGIKIEIPESLVTGNPRIGGRSYAVKFSDLIKKLNEIAIQKGYRKPACNVLVKRNHVFPGDCGTGMYFPYVGIEDAEYYIKEFLFFRKEDIDFD